MRVEKFVASTPENLTKREDLSCNSNTANTGCPLQTGGISSSGGGGGSGSGSGGTSSNTNQQQQQENSASERGFSSGNINTQQIAGSVVGAAHGAASAGGVNSTYDFSKITSPSSLDCTQEYNSSSSNISITNNSSVSTINGQVARHGALTIVRRSNSRKSFSQLESQHLQSQVSTPTYFSAHQGLLGDSLNDNRLGESTANTNIIPPTSQNKPSAQTPTFSQQHSTTNTAQILKMLPTSPNSGNFPLPSTDEMDDTSSTVASSSSTDLATDNLPAVDTPDACDKAALRLRSLLRMLNAGEIQADVLQKKFALRCSSSGGCLPRRVQTSC